MASYTYIVPTEPIELAMYDFIIGPIRDKDHTEGNLFLKRLLTGSQLLWEADQLRIDSIKDLWSVTQCPDEYLKYLKNIVG